MRYLIAECVVFGIRPAGWLVNKIGRVCYVVEWALFRACYAVARWGGESLEQLGGPPPTLRWWLTGGDD